MADHSVEIKVLGLRELSRGFKQLDAGLDGALKTAFLKIADHVVGVVQQRMPWEVGRAARSVKARASTRGASIAAYGQAAPYGPWLDFGGSVGRGHQPGVPWSGAIKRDWRGVPSGSGRYIYPAISEERAATAEAALDAVETAAKKASFEVRG